MDRRWDRLEVQILLALALVRIGDGNRLHQCLRIRVRRVFKHPCTWSDFHEAAQIHHAHLMADALDHRHIVADEQEGQLQIGLQFHHQVQNLRLHRHIQRRDGFIRDDQFRVQCEGAGNCDPLTLTAGHFMWEAAHEAARQMHPIKERGNPVLNFRARGDVVVLHRLCDLIHQLHLRIERSKGILKDHLHIKARLVQFFLAEAENVAALKLDLAGGRLHQAQDGSTAGGFTTARFAHEAEGLTFEHLKGHIFDRMHLRHCAAQNAALDRETGDEVFYIQQHLIGAFDRLNLGLLDAHQLHGLGIILTAHLAEFWNRRQQRLGIVVLRVLKDLVDGAFFDLIAAIHDHHAVGHLRHHRHIVGDEHHRSTGFALQTIHQCKNFGLDGHIERGCGLIRNQQTRLAGHGHCDHHTLAHAAREFMRVLFHPPLGLGDADLAQNLDGARLCLFLGHALVDSQTFGQLAAHSEHRIERRHRFLKNHSDLISANLLHQIGLGFGEVDGLVIARIEHQFARCNGAAAIFNKTHKREGRDRFARSGLPYDAQSFTSRDVKRNILNTDHWAVLGFEFDPKAFDLCNGLVQHPRILSVLTHLGGAYLGAI